MNKIIKIKRNEKYCLTEEERKHFKAISPWRNCMNSDTSYRSLNPEDFSKDVSFSTSYRDEDFLRIQSGKASGAESYKYYNPTFPQVIAVDLEKKDGGFIFYSSTVETDGGDFKLVLRQESLDQNNLDKEKLILLSYVFRNIGLDLISIIPKMFNEGVGTIVKNLIELGEIESDEGLLRLLSMAKKYEGRLKPLVPYLYIKHSRWTEYTLSDQIVNAVMESNLDFKEEAKYFGHLKAERDKEMLRDVFSIASKIKDKNFNKLLSFGLLKKEKTCFMINRLLREDLGTAYLNKLLQNRSFLKEYKGTEMEAIESIFLEENKDCTVFYKYGLDGKKAQENQNLTGVDFLKSLK